MIIKKFLKFKKSFTLLELLVVIIIVGILATAIMVFLSNARKKGRDTKRVAELGEIVKALDIYTTSYGGKYPRGLRELVESGLLPVEPKDPLNKDLYVYRYCVNSNQTKYHLGAKLENKDHNALDNDADLRIGQDGCGFGSFSGDDREGMYDLTS